MENQVSFKLETEEYNQVLDALGVIQRILEPNLISLTNDKRRDLSKMGDKTISFVEKSLEYGKAYPQYMPGFIKTDQMEVDFEAVKTLRQLNTPIERIYNLINDTSMLAGSEALHTGLSIYRTLKNAAAMGQPGAKEAAKELGQRFPRRRHRNNEDNNSTETEN